MVCQNSQLSYARDNPLRYNDPTGHDPKQPISDDSQEAGMEQSVQTIAVIALAVLGGSALTAVVYLMLRMAIKRPRRYLPHTLAMTGLTFLGCFVSGVAYFLKQPGRLPLSLILVASSIVTGTIVLGFVIPAIFVDWGP